MFDYWSWVKKQEMAEIRRMIENHIANLKSKVNRGENLSEFEQELLNLIVAGQSDATSIGACSVPLV